MPNQKYKTIVSALAAILLSAGCMGEIPQSVDAAPSADAPMNDGPFNCMIPTLPCNEVCPDETWLPWPEDMPTEIICIPSYCRCLLPPELCTSTFDLSWPESQIGWTLTPEWAISTTQPSSRYVVAVSVPHDLAQLRASFEGAWSPNDVYVEVQRADRTPIVRLVPTGAGIATETLDPQYTPLNEQHYVEVFTTPGFVGTITVSDIEIDTVCTSETPDAGVTDASIDAPSAMSCASPSIEWLPVDTGLISGGGSFIDGSFHASSASDILTVTVAHTTTLVCGRIDTQGPTSMDVIVPPVGVVASVTSTSSGSQVLMTSTPLITLFAVRFQFTDIPAVVHEIGVLN